MHSSRKTLLHKIENKQTAKITFALAIIVSVYQSMMLIHESSPPAVRTNTVVTNAKRITPKYVCTKIG